MDNAYFTTKSWFYLAPKVSLCLVASRFITARLLSLLLDSLTGQILFFLFYYSPQHNCKYFLFILCGFAFWEIISTYYWTHVCWTDVVDLRSNYPFAHRSNSPRGEIPLAGIPRKAQLDMGLGGLLWQKQRDKGTLCAVIYCLIGCLWLMCFFLQ